MRSSAAETMNFSIDSARFYFCVRELNESEVPVR